MLFILQLSLYRVAGLPVKIHLQKVPYVTFQPHKSDNEFSNRYLIVTFQKKNHAYNGRGECAFLTNRTFMIKGLARKYP